MEFKILKHKTLEDTFGVFYIGNDSEIWHSATPTLLQMGATMDYLKKTNKGKYAEKQLDDYELVVYELKEQK